MADEIPLITPKERIAELKQLKQLANQYLDFYRRTQRQPPSYCLKVVVTLCWAS
jgi:hypothetical protein